MARVLAKQASRTFCPAHTEVPGATAAEVEVEVDCAAARERRRVVGRRVVNCILKIGDV